MQPEQLFVSDAWYYDFFADAQQTWTQLDVSLSPAATNFLLANGLEPIATIGMRSIVINNGSDDGSSMILGWGGVDSCLSFPLLLLPVVLCCMLTLHRRLIRICKFQPS
jgi:hypothetical protein